MLALSTELPIEGMTCQHCVRSVTAALAKVPGVQEVTVSLADKKASVTFADQAVPRETLAAAVVEAGYQVPTSSPATPAPSSPRVFGLSMPSSPAAPATLLPTFVALSPVRSAPRAADKLERTLLDIEGMHCASCVGRVEGALKSVPGVSDARVNLATEQAWVEYQPERATLDAMSQAVAASGYAAHVPPPVDDAGAAQAERRARDVAAWQARFVTAAALLAPILAISYGAFLSPAATVWALFALSTPVQFYVGWPYLRGAVERMRHASTNMDTLVALGTGVAWLAGVYDLLSVTFSLGHTAHAAGHMPGMYFMESAMILTFITLGKYLEARGKGRTSAAIQKLMDLSPPKATLLAAGDEPVSVSPATLVPGDRILVRPGEKVPLDAEVLTGTSTADESWLTGESLPVEKQPGDTILAGTINGGGALVARVTKPRGESVLAQVVELVRRAQESKAEVQKLADRVTGWFVPAVLVTAAVTLAVWMLVGDTTGGIRAAVAVLVVACPCALGLATPTAVMAGSGRGAEQGILIKEAQALEAAGSITTVVLDKTGTVTLGKPKVVALLPAAGVSEAELLSAAASAERLSQHPLAQAVVDEATARKLTVQPAEQLNLIAGQGIIAQRGSGEAIEEIRVGNEGLLGNLFPGEESTKQRLAEERRRGRTPLLVARGGRYLGAVLVADPIAPHSRQAVDELRAMGLSVQMLTGDHPSTAEAIAAEAGITQVLAGVLPSGKEAEIRRLTSAGQQVAMVGDGVNDAPALAAAALGIAIGAGADVAIEAADIVLVQSDLRGVPRAIRLARATLRTIRQNLVWAFLYNVVLIPLAAGVFVPLWGVSLPPAGAAAAMALSSVSVVANSLWLYRRKLE